MSGSEDGPPDRGEPEHAAAARPGDELLGRSLALVRHLRRHCPWDAAQTAGSLRPYLLEEAHETADAILEGDEEELAGELGDLLLNVAFQIVVAEEREAFDGPEVVRRLEGKMRDRHPHVYGDAEEPPDWEEHKARERAEGAAGPDRPVPASLEPLARALRLQERAAAAGFEWPEPRGAADKLREELEEVERELEAAGPDGAARTGPSAGGHEARLEEEVGDLLLAAVGVARIAGVHPSTALARAGRKFEARFGRLLERARERGIEPREASPEELEALWGEAKGE